jgi:hypothetical protein
MEAEPRLKIKPLNGWKAVENPEGRATYVRESSLHSGALQFSLAHHRRGILQRATDETLVELCKKVAVSALPGGRIVSTRSGMCNFGMFGTAVACGENGTYAQAWVISDKCDFILVTHTCDQEPDAQEIAEAEQIALKTGVGYPS